MRTMALSIAALAMLFGTPVLAADMALKAPSAAAYDWTGCYIGANAGWVGSRDHDSLAPSGSYLNPPGVDAPPNFFATGDFASNIAALTHSYTINGSGALIGEQIGCNKQTGQYVFGAEFDAQWTSLKSSVNTSYAASPDPGNPIFITNPHTEQASSRLEGLLTFRGRAGYAWDRLLLYVTGGLAVGEIKSQTTIAFAATGAPTALYDGAIHVDSTTADRAGWVVGGGAEYAFAPHWSVKAELLYIDFGTVSLNSPLIAATAPFALGKGYSWSTKIGERDDVARIGVNYKLN
jgi:outer membrane immunogenic protein